MNLIRYLLKWGAMYNLKLKRNLNSASQIYIEEKDDNIYTDCPEKSYASIVFLKPIVSDANYHSDNEVFGTSSKWQVKQRDIFSIKQRNSKEHLQYNYLDRKDSKKMAMNESRSKTCYPSVTTDNPYSPSIIENNSIINRNTHYQDNQFEMSFNEPDYDSRNSFEGKMLPLFLIFGNKFLTVNNVHRLSKLVFLKFNLIIK